MDSLPHSKWREAPRYALFSAGEFDPFLEEVAVREGVLLIGADELFPELGLSARRL